MYEYFIDSLSFEYIKYNKFTFSHLSNKKRNVHKRKRKLGTIYLIVNMKTGVVLHTTNSNDCDLS